MNLLLSVRSACAPFLLFAAAQVRGASEGAASHAETWTTVVAMSGQPTPREECSFVEIAGHFYLIGGRGINPVDIFDPGTRAWSHGAPPPVEVHHFQPVVWENRIYIAGGMTGNYPTEKALDRILIYDPKSDLWSWSTTIPAGRRRGSAGAVAHEGRLILVCGIINGHTDGWVNWCDAYDFRSRTWSVLPNAPRARDHFEAVIIEGKIYLAGGRRSSAITGQVFDLTIPEVDVYALSAKTWTTLPTSSNLPKPRAGAATVAVGSELIVCGGESMTQNTAHAEVQAFDTRTNQWRNLPSLRQGRHGASVVVFDNAFFMCAGAGERGGRPLLSTLETLRLAENNAP